MGSVLSRVTYVLFEHELVEGRAHFPTHEHALDREVRLETTAGTAQHISWTSDPVQYCLGTKESSWFLPGDAAELDMSDSPPWRDLVGKKISLEWRDSDHQVLEVRTDTASVYLASREGAYWCADTITVTDTPPELPSNTSLERTREG